VRLDVPYLIVFAFLIGGYALVDWGYQRMQSRRVTMWYLLTGQSGGGQPTTGQTIVPPINPLTGQPFPQTNPITGQPWGGVVQSGINPGGTLQ
jgi:hypothetical protein